MNVAGTHITDTQWQLDDLLSPWLVSDVQSLQVSGVNLDSRLVVKGDLYLALSGASTHGIHFAQQAVDAGAVAVAISAESMDEHSKFIAELKLSGVPVVGIHELNANAASIASRFYAHPDRSMKLIAVTGTDGKTSVCRFVAQALGVSEQLCGYIGTLGWGLPESLQETMLTTPDCVALRRMLASMQKQGAQVVAIEASSHGIAEGRLDGLSIDIAVLTNLGRDHLDYHITLAAYRETKERLFRWDGLQGVVLNADDAMGHDLLLSLSGVECLAYSASGQTSLSGHQLISANQIETHHSGLSFELLDNKHEHSISSTLLGRFNVDNLLACYACLRLCGLAANDACYAIQQTTPVVGRMERLGGGDKPTVVIDYCHTPGALAVAIEATRAHCANELWVVFGCGGDRDAGKRAPMAQAAEAADRVVLTDDNPRTELSSDIIEQVMQGFTSPSEITVISDRGQAIRHALTNAVVGDLVLVAGKGHENYQIVGREKRHFSDREASIDALGIAS